MSPALVSDLSEDAVRTNAAASYYFYCYIQTEVLFKVNHSRVRFVNKC